MQTEFTKLKNILLEKCADRPVYYAANIGNVGDALIRYGSIKLFKDIGLQYKELSPHKRDWIIPSLRGGVAIFGGGGAWCKLWNHVQGLVRKLRYRFHVIVLPSTYELPYSIPNTTFFCRDKYESQKNMPDAIFCHDMAFYIGNEMGSNQAGEGKGYFFRTGGESAGKIKIPASNIDLSVRGDHFSDITPFFDDIKKCSVVYTDRLHVTIAACLLGKEVHLYPGSYFKNKAVYLSSIKGYFNNVYFHEDFDFKC